MINKAKQNSTIIFLLFLAFLAFTMLARVASVPMSTQFWGDEYFSVGVALQPTIPDAFLEIAHYEGNGPLFGILLWFWFRIVPYGDKYLLLLPQIFAALSVFAVGLAAREILGNTGGVTAAILLLINTIFIQFGNELRTYTLTVFVSALLLYTYFRRLKGQGGELLSTPPPLTACRVRRYGRAACIYALL
jgi:uncharacterized membrane protein